jgi:glycosyltransferase involved in cell wall biosynthesis
MGANPYFLYYGRLTIGKGLLDIGDALGLIDLGNFHFVFVGGSTKYKGVDIRDMIVARAGLNAGKLDFFETMSQESILDFVAGAYAVVLPSREDNLPNTCLESLRYGKLVIGTYDSSLDEMIMDGQNGLLAKKANPGSLAQKLGEAMRMEGERKRTIEASAARLETMPEFANCLDALEQYYEGLFGAQSKYNRLAK